MCRNVAPTLSFWASAARPGTRGRDSLSCHPGRSAARSGAVQTRDLVLQALQRGPASAVHHGACPRAGQRPDPGVLHRARDDVSESLPSG
jgi:hypothetical protein